MLKKAIYKFFITEQQQRTHAPRVMSITKDAREALKNKQAAHPAGGVADDLQKLLYKN